MIQGSSKSGAELKDLERQVHKARHLILQPKLKVAAIVTSIFEMEKFYPKIKIIRRPAEIGKAGFRLSAENALLKAA